MPFKPRQVLQTEAKENISSLTFGKNESDHNSTSHTHTHIMQKDN